MRRALALALALAAAALAGCGGDDEPDGTTAATEPPAATTEPAPPTATTGEPPTATTGEPPGARRGPPPGEDAGAPYSCDGRPLRALRPDGPVRVVPPIVRAGEPFAVEVTDRRARTALVSLAGVSNVPISAEAVRGRGGRLRAELTMPSGASCGNKLVTVEGDVSAEAYVAVRR